MHQPVQASHKDIDAIPSGPHQQSSPLAEIPALHQEIDSLQLPNTAQLRVSDVCKGPVSTHPHDATQCLTVQCMSAPRNFGRTHQVGSQQWHTNWELLLVYSTITCANKQWTFSLVTVESCDFPSMLTC